MVKVELRCYSKRKDVQSINELLAYLKPKDKDMARVNNEEHLLSKYIANYPVEGIKEFGNTTNCDDMHIVFDGEDTVYYKQYVDIIQILSSSFNCDNVNTKVINTKKLKYSTVYFVYNNINDIKEFLEKANITNTNNTFYSLLGKFLDNKDNIVLLKVILNYGK